MCMKYKRTHIVNNSVNCADNNLNKINLKKQATVRSKNIRLDRINTIENLTKS